MATLSSSTESVTNLLLKTIKSKLRDDVRGRVTTEVQSIIEEISNKLIEESLDNLKIKIQDRKVIFEVDV